MNSSLPLITIGIPTYNGNTRILKPLASIWSQNYPNIEIAISDNCSTDNTKEVIEEICRDHPEIKYFRQQTNIGQMPNYQFLMKNASGKYFMWVADDDTLASGVLHKYVEFMEAHPDHALVSGQVMYWKNNVPDVTEGGFTFEHHSPSLRVAHFYSKVVYGGMLHGMMRKEFTKGVSIRLVVGNDYHFVANLIFRGKARNFDFVGYNKTFGGISKNFQQYAKYMGESWIVGHFPHFKIAKDAFAEIMRRSPVFSQMFPASRFVLAIASYFGVLYCYYGRIVFGARFKNYVMGPLASLVKRTPSKA